MYVCSDTISCGNISLIDFELEQHSSSTSEGFTMLYHCAGSLLANQSISLVCSNDESSRWSADPSSHGCISASTESSGKHYVTVLFISIYMAVYIKLCDLF